MNESSLTAGSRAPLTASIDELVDRARALILPGERRILGITGAPGAGKSTLCASLVAALGDAAVLVPMDGFHLANQELDRLGRADRKGAPDTFDAGGYLSLLHRLRDRKESVVYAPVFDRSLEESIGSATPVPAETPLIITEGNYLLCEEHGWDAVRESLDETWYLDVSDETRMERLHRWRESYGHAPEDAAAWIQSVDAVNADYVESSKHRADLVVALRPAA